MQEKLQPSRLLVQDADLDHVVMQQIAGELADVDLEQFDALGRAHLGELFRGQGRQGPARFVEGVEFLTLFDRMSDVPAQGKEQRPGGAGFVQGRDVEFDETVVPADQTGRDGFGRRGGAGIAPGVAGSQGRVKRAVVGAEHLGRAERVVEAAADGVAAAPRLKRGIGPAHLEVEIDQGQAVRHGGEDALRLEVVPGGFEDGRVGGIGQNGVEMSLGEHVQRAGQRVGPNGLGVGAAGAATRRP